MSEHPELMLEDDGDVCLDWRSERGDLLTMSLHHSGSVSMAWVLGEKSNHALAHLPPEAFQVLRQIVAEDEANLAFKEAKYGPHQPGIDDERLTPSHP